ncbi:hypothetical protein [Anaerotalea alkaliphila]|uniref:Uncharacterized protein n=1 Tax=Anaerotalea alkaliphila TaxID=2662126 RepID=A0A7X5KNS8_9FIRM|nr:hypothetical protein [Anaerotalea alkaliphila]NDL68324.1 hypothetical protein [Anaerotalea alkaliphila]
MKDYKEWVDYTNTRAYFPLFIETPDDLPEVLKEYYDPESSYKVYIPENRYNRQPAILLQNYPTMMKASVVGKGSVNTSEIPFTDVVYFETEVCLLAGLLHIHFGTRTLEIPYPLIREDLIKPFVESIRKSYVPASMTECNKDDFMKKFEEHKMPLKFINYTHDALYKEADIKEVVFLGSQEKQEEGERFVLPKLVLVTDKELLLLREDNKYDAEEPQYGMITAYIPLRNFKKLNVRRVAETSKVLLDFSLADGHDCTFHAHMTAAEEVKLTVALTKLYM